MRWPCIEHLSNRLSLPAGVRARQLARDEVPAARAALSAWHPDSAVGFYDELLTGPLLERQAALRGEEDRIAERPVYALQLVIGDEPAGLLVVEHVADERALASHLSVVAPRHRGRGLGRLLLRLNGLLGEAVAVDLCHGLAELDNRPQCAALSREGWRLCGVVPDSERRLLDGQARYVPEGIYVKVLSPPEDLLYPRQEDLTPRTAALFQLLGFTGPGWAPPPGDAPPPAPAQRRPPLPPALAARVAARPAATWPDVTLLSEALPLPEGFAAYPLRRDDIPRLTALLPGWIQDLEEGSMAHLLTRDYYDGAVALAGEDARFAERPEHVAVIRRGEELAAAICSSYDAPNRTLRCEFGAVSPAHRRGGVAAALMPLWELLGQALGAETLFGWATLRHRFAQMTCERAGWRHFGLIPASERYAAADGAPRLGFEVIYGLSLVPEELSRWPAPSALSPEAAALVRLLRGAAAEGAP